MLSRVSNKVAELDFTIKKYKKLCKTISASNYEILTVENYISKKEKPNKFIILRHDVDIKPERALEFAKVESMFNIQSTYYFRMTPKVFIPTIIKEIATLGHEIGYHYEVLDKARGDYKKAIIIFESELNKLREIVDIKTICMHGNPLTKWRNIDVWNYYDFTKFGIIGEAYLSINYEDIAYFSDTGRTWDGGKYRIKDVVCSKVTGFFNIKSTDELIRLIRKEEVEKMCILSHPGQWTDDYWSWITIWLVRKTKNKIKSTILRRVHKLWK